MTDQPTPPGSDPDDDTPPQPAWAAPVGPTPAGPTPSTPYGPPGASAPGGIAPGGIALGGQAPGWTPPPKPGLIPLRPLEFGTLLSAPFQLLRRNPRPTFGVALLFQAIVLVVSTVVVGLVTFAAFSRIDFAGTGADTDALTAGAIATVLLSVLVPIALSLISSGLMQGIVVLEAARQTLGEKLRFPQLWALARGRLWAVVGYTVLLTLAALLVVAILVGIIVALSLIGDGAIIAAVLVGVFGGLGIVVLLAWISTKLALTTSAIVLERTTIVGGIRRSWRLTDGAFWKTFGVILLVSAVLGLATALIVTPLQLIAQLAVPILAPLGDPTVIAVIGIGSTLVVGAVNAAFGGLALVIQSATTALIYLDRRMRTEALDADLVRFVEARQEGRDPGPDPFMPRDTAR